MFSLKTIVSALLVASIVAVPTTLGDNLKSTAVDANGFAGTVGQPIGVSFHLIATNNDNHNGCNVSPSAPGTVTITPPSGVSASSTSLTFTGCGTANSKVTYFTANAAGQYQFRASNFVVSGGSGTYNTAPGSFTLSVSAPVAATPTSEPTPTIAPVLSLPGALGATATSTSGATVSYTASAHDDLGAVPITCTPASGSVFAPGMTSVQCSASNSVGTTTGSFTVSVTYAWSGFQNPIANDGKGHFKAGSTIPVKFALVGDSAGIGNLAATGSMGSASGSFRYDPVADQYIWNLSTRGMAPGTYTLNAVLGDESAGVLRTVTITLR